MSTKEAICFGCDVVRQMDAAHSSERCACGGNALPLLNIEAFRTARLAHRLGGGYYAHVATLKSATLTDLNGEIDWRHIGEVPRKDGTQHTFSFDHYIREAFANAATFDDLTRVWISGALINLGDALAQAAYFDRAPHLELVRHLRNGVAHGNRFRLDRPASLVKYPAHNHFAGVRSPSGSAFEITPAVQGNTVMFDFMGPADFLDLFFSVEIHLFTLAVVAR